jgi:Amt family ammonium transporter
VLVSFVKNTLKVDDSLDVFAVHGVGGVLGILLVSFLIDSDLGGVGYGEGINASSQLNVQLIGIASVFAWSIFASLVIIVIVKALTGLRVEEAHEEEGLDISSHGETNYRQ